MRFLSDISRTTAVLFYRPFFSTQGKLRATSADGDVLTWWRQHVARCTPTSIVGARALLCVGFVFVALPWQGAHGFGATQCAADRAGTSLNCTANDTSVTTVTS